MTSTPQLTKFGYRFGHSGAHSARTMMLAELTALLAHLPETATREDYVREVKEHNVLGKPTTKSRSITLRHLIELYGLDPAVPLFRIFRRLWGQDVQARPVLALETHTRNGLSWAGEQ